MLIDAYICQCNKFSWTCLFATKILNTWTHYYGKFHTNWPNFLSYEVLPQTILLGVGHKTFSKKLGVNSCFVIHNIFHTHLFAMKISKCSPYLLAQPLKISGNMNKNFFTYEVVIQQNFARPRRQQLLAKHFGPDSCYM